VARHADVWGSGGIAPPHLTSALDGGEWSASRPGRFNSGEITPRYPLDRRLGGLVGLDAVEKKKVFPSAAIRTPAVQPVAISTEVSRFLILLVCTIYMCVGTGLDIMEACRDVSRFCN
jgi:hypothetical protein